MIKDPVRFKVQMYNMLQRGDFGNTLPTYHSLEEWRAAQKERYFPLWCLRSNKSSLDSRTRWNVPAEQVPDTFNQLFPFGDANLSSMIDEHLVLRGQLIDSSIGGVLVPVGLKLWYSMVGPRLSWRQAFSEDSYNVHGLQAWNILKGVMNSNSVEDMRELIDAYPDHTIEFTVLNKNMGTMRNRNTLIWEVRQY